MQLSFTMDLMKLFLFIISYNKEFHPGPARTLQTCMTYTIAECTVNELLMMDRGTLRNM